MAKISIAGLNYSSIIIESTTPGDSYYWKAGKKVILTNATSGNDTIIGGNNTDYIEAGAGADIISGGNGKDTIYGGSGDDTINGDSSQSLDTTENAKDILYGGSGKDKIYGGNGADVIYGDGKDTGAGSLIDGSGITTVIETEIDAALVTYNDQLNGGNGPDVITGGLGGDTLTGGAGGDIFVYDRIFDSRSADGEVEGTSATDWDGANVLSGFQTGTGDYITDFTKGQDQLDFTTLNQVNPLLHFSGMAPAANGIWYLQDGGYTYIFADTSGSGGADIAIKVMGNIAFSNSDFVGINDAPDITGSDVSEAVIEGDTTLNATGSLNVMDPDMSDTVTMSVTGVAVSGTSTFSGTNPLTAGAMQAMMTVTGGALAADPSAGTNFDWTFTSGASGNGAFNFLAAGETLVLQYTLTATDNGSPPASDTQDVVITITGTNDAPVIIVGGADSAAAGLTETGAGLSANGTLTVTDVDLSDTVASTVTAVVATGAPIRKTWSSSSRARPFSALGTDSAAATIAEIDSALLTSGTLTVTDVDLSDTVDSSATVVATGVTTGLGSNNAALQAMLTLTPSSGLAADTGDAPVIIVGSTPLDEVRSFPYHKRQIHQVQESAMPRIHEVATITSKGQITLPKPIRQALGVDSGGKVAFDFNGKAITVSRAETAEHTDPAIAKFLALLERDLVEGKNVTVLPAALAKSLKQALKRPVDLSREIKGNVSL